MPRSDGGRSGLLRAQLRVGAGALLATAGVLLAVAPAQAEEIFTGQAAAANATDSTWIPAPAVPVAVCIVDTGNDANADTANVIARLAVDDGDGGDLGATKHGTLMSMIASAPYNGFGMVGIAPSIKVVSVRATRNGDGFTFADVLNGIDVCRRKAIAYNIKVVSLSLGAVNTGPLDSATHRAMSDAVASARAVGIDVVAAAGNHAGAADWPAAYGPVLAVGASDASGARCDFAASGPEVDLWAAGCPQDVALPDGRPAWASGSSEATALTAAVLAQLRSLRPDLTVDAAEALLTASARAQQVGRTLDVDGAFRAAGLGDQLGEGHASIPDLSPPVGEPSTEDISIPDHASPAATPASAPPVVAEIPTATPIVTLPEPGVEVAAAARGQLAKPSARSVRLRHGLLTVTLKNKPKGVQVCLEVYARRKGRAFPVLARRLRVTGDRLRTRISGTLSQVSITYRDPKAVKRTSAPLSLHPR